MQRLGGTHTQRPKCGHSPPRLAHAASARALVANCGVKEKRGKSGRENARNGKCREGCRRRASRTCRAAATPHRPNPSLHVVAGCALRGPRVRRQEDPRGKENKNWSGRRGAAVQAVGLEVPGGALAARRDRARAPTAAPRLLLARRARRGEVVSHFQGQYFPSFYFCVAELFPHSGRSGRLWSQADSVRGGGRGRAGRRGREAARSPEWVSHAQQARPGPARPGDRNALR